MKNSRKKKLTATDIKNAIYDCVGLPKASKASSSKQPQRLVCPIHNRILIGKKYCVDCQPSLQTCGKKGHPCKDCISLNIVESAKKSPKSLTKVSRKSRHTTKSSECPYCKAHDLKDLCKKHQEQWIEERTEANHSIEYQESSEDKKSMLNDLRQIVEKYEWMGGYDYDGIAEDFLRYLKLIK